MATTIASCGHDITKEQEKDFFSCSLSIMDYTEEGCRAIRYLTACASCRKEYESWGIVLHNNDEETEWIAGMILYPQFNNKM
jgi:hypothetical protein